MDKGLNVFQEILKNLIVNPTATFCLLLVVAMGFIYKDATGFINEQQIILKDICNTQQQITVELRELNLRLEHLEQKEKNRANNE